jgi:O-methyltransferase
MNPGGKLLIVDTILKPAGELDWGRVLDLEMMMFPGGRERTEEQFRTLLSAAGWLLNQVIPTKSALSIVEAGARSARIATDNLTCQAPQRLLVARVLDLVARNHVCPFPCAIMPSMNAGFQNGRWFYVSMASLLLTIVAIGFARSFYLRNTFHPGHAVTSDIPTYIILHGIVLTLWFLLFLAQTILIRSGHVRLHRLLGSAGACLAVVVFSLSMLVVARSVVRETSLVVVGDFALLILFAILFGASMRFRRKPEVHRRLMLVASISNVAPAIARWPGAQKMLPLSVVLPQLLLFAALIIYDLALKRRVHPASAWGVASYIIALGISIPLALTQPGRAFVNALK